MSVPFTATSRKPDAAPVPDRRLIVSFHDLHPGSRAACQRLLDHLARAGIERTTLLVVPRWHGGEPFTQDTGFTAWLRDLEAAGHEISLHGWTHQAERVRGGPWSRVIGLSYTQGEGEFFQIDRSEAFRRVRQGLAMLSGEAGVSIYGFTPPAWLLSRDGRTALREAGLHYTTTWGSVDLLQSATVVRSPTLVYSCRNAWRRIVSRAWLRLWHRRNRTTELLRIAVHPGDLADARVEASLLWHLQAAMDDGRRAITYCELLPPETEPVSVPDPAVA